MLDCTSTITFIQKLKHLLLFAGLFCNIMITINTHFKHYSLFHRATFWCPTSNVRVCFATVPCLNYSISRKEMSNFLYYIFSLQFTAISVEDSSNSCYMLATIILASLFAWLSHAYIVLILPITNFTPLGRYRRSIDSSLLRLSPFCLVTWVMAFSPACHLSLHHTFEPSCKPPWPSYIFSGRQKAENTLPHLRSFAKASEVYTPCEFEWRFWTRTLAATPLWKGWSS